MNTARIVVPTFALSTGSVAAACLVNGPADTKPARTESAVQLPAASGIGTARFGHDVSTATQR